MRSPARVLFHARALIVGLGGLVLMWGGIAMIPGGREAMTHGSVAPTAAAAAMLVFVATSWLGWIDLVSALSLSIDDRALAIGWPTRRVIPWSEVTSLQRSIGTLRLVVKTQRSTDRIQLLVDRTPPKTLVRMVRSIGVSGGNVEEYLLKLAEYVEDSPDPD